MGRSGYRGHFLKQTPWTVSLCTLVFEELGEAPGVWFTPSWGPCGYHSRDAISGDKLSQLSKIDVPNHKMKRGNPTAFKFLQMLAAADHNPVPSGHLMWDKKVLRHVYDAAGGWAQAPCTLTRCARSERWALQPAYPSHRETGVEDQDFKVSLSNL